MRTPLLAAALAGLFAVASTPTLSAGPEGPLVTRWAAKVDRQHPWPEHPRPDLARLEWTNLNGEWEWSIAKEGEAAPSGKTLEGRILVPFPIESTLSGVGQHHERFWYRRTFDAPANLAGRRLMLRFEAVDWEARVFVNGREIGSHRGGYDPFAFDITDALKAQGPQEVVVGVWDPTDQGEQPRGKQVIKPEGIWYTPSSGIWQTVWLEPVAPTHIEELKVTTDPAAGGVRIQADLAGSSEGTSLRARVLLEGKEVAKAEGTTPGEVAATIAAPKLWSPETPVMYDLEIDLLKGGGVIDHVTSSVGLRKIEIGKDAKGINRVLLNGAEVFMAGPLDQGYWPDGICTPPTDEAMKFDLEQTKLLGFNTTRKHVKVEPRRWYHWADRLGLLVWQDMPNSETKTSEGKAQHERELEALIRTHRNHASIVMWVVFNEGWGQYDTERLTKWVKALDPTRLVNNASGWTDAGAGDVHDIHAYPDAQSPPNEVGRAAMLGEFGGLGLATPGHMWKAENWGYQGMRDAAHLTRRYGELLRHAYELRERGLCSAIYTQITDVEIECNGLLTYDRAVMKGDAALIARANKGDFAWLPTRTAVIAASDGAESPGAMWRYTTTKPAEGWSGEKFDDAAWKEGPAGFGSKGTPGAEVRTEWTTGDIWLRRSAEAPVKLPEQLWLWVHHDEDAEVHINGVLAANLKGYTTGYVEMPLSAEARAALKPGKNVIGVHCHQTSGGQYFDVGIVSFSTPK